MLKPLLKSLLAKLSPAQRRQLAAEARELADEQERLADALEREQRRPAKQRVGQKGAGGRPGSMEVYLFETSKIGRNEPLLKLRIGRGVYDAYCARRADPAAELAMSVQISGGQLLLVEDRGGYAASVTQGGIQMSVQGSRDHLLSRMEIGRKYAARATEFGIVADL